MATSFAPQEGRIFGKDSQARPGIHTFLTWLKETEEFFRHARQESWRDAEMYDGVQWTAYQAEALQDLLGMQALTINRTFPTLNLLLGMQRMNRHDIVAKGRTHKDIDLSPIASEAIKYIGDQNEGERKITEAFKDQLIPGFGLIEVLKNPDPREETVKWAKRQWSSFWWDHHGNPWLDTDVTRYCFLKRWLDIENVIMGFPEHKKDLMHRRTLAEDYPNVWPTSTHLDEYEEELEGRRQLYSSHWVDTTRNRIQVVQMWYTVMEEILFSVFEDGTAKEVSEKLPFNQQYELITAGREVVTAVVPKMRVATFTGDLLLQDIRTPHHHDYFPFVPFVGYVDRFGRPFGVPRQIRDMDIEVNKRRTTALAKLNSKRVLVEEDAHDDLDELRREASRPDAMIVLAKGALNEGKIQIDGDSEDLRGQIELLRDSEREIHETAGALQTAMGYETNVTTGVAIKEKTQNAAPMTAALFDNLRISKKRLGWLTLSTIKQTWTGPKLLRVTDRFRGGERLVKLNERVEKGGVVEVKNNIAEGKFDIVVTDDIKSDVLREKYAEILIESTKRAAPEAVPMIIDVAFELLDLPGKDILLSRLRDAFGLEMPPDYFEMSKDEVAQMLQQKKQAEAQQEAEVQKTEMEKLKLQNEEILAKIERFLAQAAKDKAEIGKTEVDSIYSLSENQRQDEAHAKEMVKPIEDPNAKYRIEQDKIQRQERMKEKEGRTGTDNQ